ncbi:hypothetical protein DAEQUDRAFT_769504 [Daedalea quercina L-15889]|uniref:Uncharacterized protein n=1 Tax=Daedalea quercina L-15889 TaxID=1314783 RepID=A0A165LNF8_9APHY|nr:hypothetical protein DAEQUDRAFT_769504 [Daedalea quercina L-15889]
MCSANEAEACTLPPDVCTLTDLMRGNIFTPPATCSWRIVADHLFLASWPIMNHYPTDLTPVYFHTKQIALENITRWFVVHGGRVDGVYYDLQQATEQSFHMGTALVTSYASQEEAQASLDRMRVEGIPFIDQTLPLTPYPAAHLRMTLAECPMTPIEDSPMGVDKNIPPWNWTVDDNFETAHNPLLTPLPIVAPPLTAKEQGWIAH